MNTKISMFVICVEAIIYLLLYNLHDCTSNLFIFLIELKALLNNLFISYLNLFISLIKEHQLKNTCVILKYVK